MKYLNHLYQHINILSLDVAAGAVIGALFFARILNVEVPLNVLVSLGLTVWIIYTLDHLRDAMTITKTASTDRHRFHQEHFLPMVVALAVVALIDLIFAFFLPVRILTAGILLGLTVLIYLLLQRYLKFLKEIFVACLYTAGILLPCLAVTRTWLLSIHLLIIGKFFITALMNLLLFSLFDYNEDRDHRQHSFVTWFGPKSTRFGIAFLGLLNILSGFALWQYSAGVALVFICMNIVLLTILFFGDRLLANNYYRMLGDAVFFIPAFYLI